MSHRKGSRVNPWTMPVAIAELAVQARPMAEPEYADIVRPEGAAGSTLTTGSPKDAGLPCRPLATVYCRVV